MREVRQKLILETFLLSLHDGGYVEYVVCGSVCWPDRTEPSVWCGVVSPGERRPQAT